MAFTFCNVENLWDWGLCFTKIFENTHNNNKFLQLFAMKTFVGTVILFLGLDWILGIGSEKPAFILGKNMGPCPHDPALSCQGVSLYFCYAGTCYLGVLF